MRIIVINERATPPMRSKRVRRDVRRALSFRPHVAMWNELPKWSRYVRILKDVFNYRAGWRHAFEGRRNVISVDSDQWRVVDLVSHQLTRGARWIPQPRRFTNVAILRNIQSGAIVAVVISHFTNGKNRRRFTLRSRRARERLWDEQYRDTAAILTDLYERGITAIFGGDYNDLRFRIFHVAARWVVEAGFMKLGILEAPGGARLNVKDAHPVGGLETDHRGLFMRAAVTDG